MNVLRNISRKIHFQSWMDRARRVTLNTKRIPAYLALGIGNTVYKRSWVGSECQAPGSSQIMGDLGVNESLINQLPDDCLAHIFSFLPILERLEVEKVCKRWHIICEKGWHDIKELKIDQMYSDDIIYLMLKRCGRFLRKLSIFDSPKQFYNLSMVIQSCKLDQLEEIAIWFDIDAEEEKIELHISNLTEIIEKTEKLVAVTIAGALMFYGIDCLNFLNPEILRKLVLGRSSNDLSINPDRYPNLKELKLQSIGIIGDEMKREEKSLKGLEKMDIRCCHIPQNFIQRIETFTNLQELTLKNNICDIRNEHIRDIARHCYKIKKMALVCLSTLTSECFQYLGEMLSLEVLIFEDVIAVDSRDIVYLANVRKLIFWACMDIINGDGLIELIVSSPNLDELELYNIRALNINFLNDIQRIFLSGQRGKHLRVIVVVDWDEKRLAVTREVIHHPLLDLRVYNYKTYDQRRGEREEALNGDYDYLWNFSYHGNTL